MKSDKFYIGIKDIKFKKSGLKITASESIFWPCYRLAVSLECRDEIDPFAKVVLKMAYCGITNTDEIAETLCLDSDFVKLLQAKLVHKDFLDEKYCITKETKKLMDQTDFDISKSEKIKRTKSIGYIFEDALTGYILPFPTKDSAIDPVSFDREKDFASFYSRDDNKAISGPVVSNQQNFVFRIPTDRECLNVCRKGDFSQVGSVELISKDKENSDLILLHLTAFIQYGQTKIFVNGMNTSISDNFTQYIAENGASMGWVSKLREKSKSTLEDVQKKDKIESKFIYPNISKKIEANNKIWETIKKESSYSDEKDNHEERKNLTTIASNLYSIIELGLAENFKKHPSKDAESILSLCDQENINDYIQILAKKIGIDIENVKSILTFKKGTVKGICRGDEKCTQMESLLALHIANATIKNEHFFFDKDFDINQFFKDIVYLKTYRNIDQHGSAQIAIAKEEIQKVMERVYFVLLKIVPNIREDFKILGKQDFSSRRDLHTLRMNALEELEKVFGSTFMVNLESKNYQLYDLLQKTERAFQEKTSSKINNFYILLQYVFFDCSKKLSGGKRLYDDFKTLIQSKEENLPNSIKTVKENFVKKAVLGENAESLGAAISAFIVHCPTKDYEYFSKENSNWLNFCDSILNKRGHGNTVVNLENKEKDYYRQQTYELVKSLFSQFF